ncbi:MAG: hypothetical protein IPO21_18000 [Bacteroidales bacterium]|nr:hypothetical protein [Bacteroidales bacterium]
MNLFRQLSGILLIVILLSIFGCEKSFQSDIVGEWKLESLGDSAIDAHDPVWIFHDDNTLELIDCPSINFNKEPRFGTYKIDSKWVVVPMVEISEISDAVDGIYQIDKLDKTTLRMTRIKILDKQGDYIKDGAYLRKEFTKK